MSYRVYIGPKNLEYDKYFEAVQWNFPDNNSFVKNFIWQYPLKIYYHEEYVDEIKDVMKLLSTEGREFTKLDSSGRMIDFYRVYKQSETGGSVEVDSV